MAERYRTHLLVKGLPACNQEVIHSASKRPSEVTCTKCQSSIKMADVEARLAVSPTRRKERP